MDIRHAVSIVALCCCSVAVYEKAKVNPFDVKVPSYHYDREHSKKFVNAVRSLSDHNREMVNGYVGMCEMYNLPIDSSMTIGKAIDIMEKTNETGN